MGPPAPKPYPSIHMMGAPALESRENRNDTPFAGYLSCGYTNSCLRFVTFVLKKLKDTNIGYIADFAPVFK